MISHETRLSTLFSAYFALVALLVLTAWAAHLPPGLWSTPVSLAIAFAKTAIIFAIFMRLRWQPGLVTVFALAGFFWLGILGVLALSDYLSRGWLF